MTTFESKQSQNTVSMDIQRLRNLTTGFLHTEIGYVYQDLEFFIGKEGVFTHMIPNLNRALKPYLQGKLSDPRFWDGKYDPTHTGKIDIEPMGAEEKAAFIERYKALPHPFSR